MRAFYDSFVHDEVVVQYPRQALDGAIFRRDPVDITSKTGRIIHRGRFLEEKIIEAVRCVLAILHDETLPLLVRVAVSHYLLAYIHPFYDGNGRTIRFLSIYALSKQYHPLAVIRLSVMIKKKQKTYYELFEETDGARNRGDLTGFVLGFMDFVASSMEDATRLLIRKNEQLQKYRKRIDAMYLSDALMRDIYDILLQAAMFYGRGATIHDLEEATGRTRVTIQKRLDLMPQDHIIKTRHRSIYYKLNLMMFKL